MATLSSDRLAGPAGEPFMPAQPATAVFELSRPIATDGEDGEVETHGLGMRALAQPDLAMLDQFHGQPIALSRAVIGALCDITPGQVEQLALDDFAMLAADALFQVEQLSTAMGLPPRFFLEPRAAETAQ